MKDRIDLRGIRVQARHGVLAEEHTRDQLFLVDATIYLDLTAPALSDDLADTLDYGEAARLIHDTVAGESHRLIETTADRVAERLLADPRVEGVLVTVHKPEAPMPVDFADVSVTVQRGR